MTDPTLPDPATHPAPDAALDAWLAGLADPPVADEGFSAAVLHRVQALQDRERLAPQHALRLLQQRRAHQRWQARCLAAGAALGMLLATGMALAAPGVLPGLVGVLLAAGAAAAALVRQAEA